MLGSINLAEFVRQDKTFDFDDFKTSVRIAVDALNEVLDEGLPLHPLQEQRDSVRDWRAIGLGIFGLADALIKMEIRYGSKEAVEFCDSLGYLMAYTAIEASSDLTEKFGKYPKYNEKAILQSPYWSKHTSVVNRDRIWANGLANSQLLTIAPTGSLSSMLGVSGGIEPIFANYYVRKTESLHGHDEYYKVYTPIVKEYMDAHGITDDKDLPECFITAQNLDFKERIDMQAAWQKHIDASISSTINVPNNFTVEQVEQLYLYAWEKGLKGVTIFRDGCKRTGILTTNDAKKEEHHEPVHDHEEQLPRGYIIKADDNCVGKKRTLQTGCGTLHCVAMFDPDTGDLLETYLSKGSSGGCVDADTEYFNGNTWKRISEYRRDSNEKVLQYNENGFAELVEPINYIVNDNVGTLKRFKNSTGLDMVLSGDHRMFLYKNYRKYSLGMRSTLTTEVVTVDEYLNREGSKERHVPTTFKLHTKGIPLTNDQIRLLVAVYADGCYDGHKIVISFKKERKKVRLRELLTACDVGWTERNIHNTDYTYFHFHLIPSIAEWFKDKRFTSKWYDCSDEQLKVVVDECIHWDGSEGEGNRFGMYYSSKKEEVDFIQFALTRLGYRAVISDNTGSKCSCPSYRVRWTKVNVHDLKHASVTDYKTVDNHSYCFTVPSGFLVLRRNGKIFITGNCNNYMTGLSRMISLSARAGVDIYSIIDQLKSCGSCPSYAVRSATKHDTSKGACCPMAVGNALLDMYKEMQDELCEDDEAPVIKEKRFTPSVKKKEENKASAGIKCPQCGATALPSGGCYLCPSCGWSKCD